MKRLDACVSGSEAWMEGIDVCMKGIGCMYKRDRSMDEQVRCEYGQVEQAG